MIRVRKALAAGLTDLVAYTAAPRRMPSGHEWSRALIKHQNSNKRTLLLPQE